MRSFFLVVSATEKIKHNTWSSKVSIFGFSGQQRKWPLIWQLNDRKLPACEIYSWNEWVLFQREQLEDPNGLEYIKNSYRSISYHSRGNDKKTHTHTQTYFNMLGVRCIFVQSLSRVQPTLCYPRGLQYARLPWPSPSPRVCSDSCPLSQWCHPAISSSVLSSPPVLNLTQHQGLFQ